jgi:LacI family transcriptional regulator
MNKQPPKPKAQSGKVTMQDIANHLQIDRTTVSKAMSATPGVSRSMVERVREAARVLGYQKDIFASGLVTGKNALLGIVLSDISRGIYAPLVAHFQQTAKMYNYGIILQCVDNSSDDIVNAIQLLKQQRVSGVTFISDATFAKHNSLLIDLVRCGIAVNTTRRDFIHPGIDSIRFDHKMAGYDATEHLIRLGHRKIAFVAYEGISRTPLERMEGYIQAMNASGLQAEVLKYEGKERVTASPSTHVQAAYRLISSEWKGKRNPPSALIGANDSFALGILHALKDEGLRIPEQASIVGFDDWQAVLAVPQITSSRIPLAEAGDLAVRLLIGRLEEPNKPFLATTLECELIVRESTSPFNLPRGSAPRN